MATIITAEEAARMLCIAKKTLLNRQNLYGKVPYHKPTPQKIVFIKEEVQKFIDDNFVVMGTVGNGREQQGSVGNGREQQGTVAPYSFSLSNNTGKEYKLSSVIRAYYHKQYEEMTNETIKPDPKQVISFNRIVKRMSESKPEKYNEQYFCALVEFCLQQGIVALSAIVSESLRGSFEVELCKGNISLPQKPKITAADLRREKEELEKKKNAKAS